MFGNWESGEALIVEQNLTGQTSFGMEGGNNITHHYIADVEPTSGAPMFRATWKDKGKSNYAVPKPGQRVPVKFQAKGQKVKIDYENWPDGNLNRILGLPSKDAERKRWDAVAHAAPGSEAGASGQEDPRPRVLTPEQLREIALAQRASRDSGTASSPADEIAKLAALRDSGALTEAEFRAQKDRLLGE